MALSLVEALIEAHAVPFRDFGLGYGRCLHFGRRNKEFLQFSRIIEAGAESGIVLTNLRRGWINVNLS